ncbi:MAG: 2-phospho-L-lactate guanylyltransferase [Thaumarchaeota archaeon]|nr:2-phospho-L-lactate guanylyltransferase [Nitrososphaerota archaeon]
MRLYSITPVRMLSNGKSRLSSVLSPSQREHLSKAMLSEVLSKIQSSKITKGMLVVSPDQEVIKIASNFGAHGIKEEAEHGVNAAVEKGIEYALKNRADSIVVLPADLPRLNIEDLVSLVAAVEEDPTVVMTPSNRLDGTNALLMKPPAVMNLHYDQDSFRSHVLEAIEQNVRLKTVLRNGLMSDLDDQTDLTEYLRSDSVSEVKKYLLSIGLP